MTIAQLSYDPFEDELIVGFAVADEVDRSHVDRELTALFDHNVDGRLLAVLAKSPSLGKTKEWNESVRALIGDTLWAAFRDAQDRGSFLESVEISISKAEVEILEQGWREEHRRVRDRLGFERLPTVPAKRRWSGVILSPVLARSDERRRVEDTAPSDIQFDEEIRTFGYQPNGKLRSITDTELALTLPLATSPPGGRPSVTATITGPGRVSGTGTGEPADDAFSVEIVIQLSHPIASTRLGDITAELEFGSVG